MKRNKTLKVGVSIAAALLISPVICQGIVANADENNTQQGSTDLINNSNSTNIINNNSTNNSETTGNSDELDKVNSDYATKSVDENGNTSYSISDDDLYNYYQQNYPEMNIQAPNNDDKSSNPYGMELYAKTKGSSSIKFYGPIKNGNFRISLSKWALNTAKSNGISFLLSLPLAPVGALMPGIYYMVMKSIISHVIVHINHFNYGRNFYFGKFNYQRWTYQRA